MTAARTGDRTGAMTAARTGDRARPVREVPRPTVRVRTDPAPRTPGSGVPIGPRPGPRARPGKVAGRSV
jgi:hypothetical protein